MMKMSGLYWVFFEELDSAGSLEDKRLEIVSPSFLFQILQGFSFFTSLCYYVRVKVRELSFLFILLKRFKLYQVFYLY